MALINKKYQRHTFSWNLWKINNILFANNLNKKSQEKHTNKNTLALMNFSLRWRSQMHVLHKSFSTIWWHSLSISITLKALRTTTIQAFIIYHEESFSISKDFSNNPWHGWLFFINFMHRYKLEILFTSRESWRPEFQGCRAKQLKDTRTNLPSFLTAFSPNSIQFRDKNLLFHRKCSLTADDSHTTQYWNNFKIYYRPKHDQN